LDAISNFNRTQITQIERIHADYDQTGFKSDTCLAELFLS
jgi:hypothetical protein